MSRYIPVSQPLLGDVESRYVNEALAEGAISGHFGKFLPQFEGGFAHYCDCQFGVGTSGGTPALHLAMATLNIGSGDEVLVSNLTMMSTLFAIVYQNATPVLIDIEPDTLNLDPKLLEVRITPRTKAIMVAHLFGHPVDMEPIIAIAKKHNLVIIEDCAEAHGATYNGRKVGSLGDIGCFSFYSNKIITTGEGGMITTNSPHLAKRAKMLRGLAFGEHNKFMHQDVGFNYRMSNIQAALGCAQLEKIEKIITAKRHMAAYYQERLSGIPGLQLPIEKDYARNVYWMYHMVLTGHLAGRRTDILLELEKKGIETREGFIPANLQEIFIKKGFTSPKDCPLASAIAYDSFYIPSSPTLTNDELDYVSTQVRQVLEEA